MDIKQENTEFWEVVIFIVIIIIVIIIVVVVHLSNCSVF